MVRRAIAADLQARNAPSSNSSADLVTFLTGAYMAMLRAWLVAGATPEAQVIDAAYRRLANGAVVASAGAH